MSMDWLGTSLFVFYLVRNSYYVLYYLLYHIVSTIGLLAHSRGQYMHYVWLHLVGHFQLLRH